MVNFFQSTAICRFGSPQNIHGDGAQIQNIRWLDGVRVFRIVIPHFLLSGEFVAARVALPATANVGASHRRTRIQDL